MDINEICSYRIDCYDCPRENDCLILKKKDEDKRIKRNVSEITIVQGRELICIVKEGWKLLNSEDYNQIINIFKKAANRRFTDE